MSIDADSAAVRLTDAQRAELQKRIEEDDANPDDVTPWSKSKLQRSREGSFLNGAKSPHSRALGVFRSLARRNLGFEGASNAATKASYCLAWSLNSRRSASASAAAASPLSSRSALIALCWTTPPAAKPSLLPRAVGFLGVLPDVLPK
jgi:putative addiction module component (TIGR02574 family)